MRVFIKDFALLFVRNIEKSENVNFRPADFGRLLVFKVVVFLVERQRICPIGIAVVLGIRNDRRVRGKAAGLRIAPTGRQKRQYNC